VGSLVRTDELADSGAYSLRCDGVQYGGPHQAIDFEPGVYCLVARLYLPEGQEEGGFVDLSLTPLDDISHNLPKGSTTSITPAPGRWHTVATVMDVREPPAGAVAIRAGVWARDFPEGKRIYIDDVVLIRLADDAEAQ